MVSSVNKHLPITAKMRMADLIHLDYRLIPIIGRFGINMGFGNKNVTEICEATGIDTDFFLEIINSYHNSDYFPKDQLQNFSSQLIIQYLSNTHQFYLTIKVKEIEAMIDTLSQQVYESNGMDMELFRSFFKEYKIELERHFEKEETEVFPYVHALEKACATQYVSPELLRKLENEPIERYERNHGDVEEKITDLKNLIMKFLPPVKPQDLCQNLLMELFRMENDLQDHSRIEERVLVPKVKLLEKKVLQIG